MTAPLTEDECRFYSSPTFTPTCATHERVAIDCLRASRDEAARLREALIAVCDGESDNGRGIIGGHIGNEFVEEEDEGAEEPEEGRCTRREECVTCIVLDALTPKTGETK
jgi:hypothetical protein